MITLKINGQTVQIEKDATILAAAEKTGIRIPTLCYLKKVSPTGACRICVVDVKGAEKPMASCHTPAEEGMEVTTESPRLSKIRKQVIELLLVNHPLDCPVCDAAGECELQNICYEHDVTTQPFVAEDVNADAITGWPLIEQVPNRCVMCEKCVKVCHEVIGADALCVNLKGDRAFIDKNLAKCEFCGNCVQVCPTGTMISKPFKFQARGWELSKVPSTCTSCGSQCQIELNVKNNRLFRVTSTDGVTCNDGNLCFNGFFGSDYVHSPLRLTAPLLKSGNRQRRVDWDEALNAAATALQSGKVAGIAGNRLTNEEAFLFQHLFHQGLGCNDFDSESRFGIQRAYDLLQTHFGMQGGTFGLDRIAAASAVLVIGADPTAEAPAVDWLTQQACRKNDGKMVVVNARTIKLSQYANVPMTCRPGSEGIVAGALARLILDQGLADSGWLAAKVANLAELRAALAGVNIDQAAAACGVSRALLEEAAELLGRAPSVAIVFGGDIYRESQFAGTIGAILNLALISGALQGESGGLYPIGAGANSQGLLKMGVASDLFPGGQKAPTSGRDLGEILVAIETGEVRTLFVTGANPLAFPESGRWQKALAQLDSLIVQDCLASELTDMAQIVLPGASFVEKSGTVTSSAHKISTLAAAIAPVGSARPDQQILGDLLARIAPAAVLDPVQLAAEVARCSVLSALPSTLRAAPMPLAEPLPSPVLLAGKDLYYAAATNSASAASHVVVPGGYIALNPTDAAGLGVKAGEKLKITSKQGILEGSVHLLATVPAGVCFVPYNCADVNVQAILPSFGSNTETVTLSKA
ncbi:MAG: NADH-quinone oxidoreductase subunit G [Deltaproteobacteria bacterium HGW-Deltaproteobacteria-4]|nr:MAG: NADH-quinone oxidoreductase subunit G [Deltaproteobacteria bacterium HGW-Deltaproteobacteria-4]